MIKTSPPCHGIAGCSMYRVESKRGCRSRTTRSGRRDLINPLVPRMPAFATVGRRQPSMNTVTIWLGELGLGQYATVFAENAVDATVLPDLNEADLEKMGIPLGHRKRMLKAIVALRAGAEVQADPAPAGP